MTKQKQDSRPIVGRTFVHYAQLLGAYVLSIGIVWVLWMLVWLGQLAAVQALDAQGPRFYEASNYVNAIQYSLVVLATMVAAFPLVWLIFTQQQHEHPAAEAIALLGTLCGGLGLYAMVAVFVPAVASLYGAASLWAIVLSVVGTAGLYLWLYRLRTNVSPKLWLFLLWLPPFLFWGIEMGHRLSLVPAL